MAVGSREGRSDHKRSNTDLGKQVDSLGEDGLSSFSFLVLSAGGLAWYLKIGYPLFGASFPAVYNFIAIALLSIFTLFAFGCCLHMMLIQAPSSRKLTRAMLAEVNNLEEITRAIAQQIQKYEFVWFDSQADIGPRAKQTLSAIRRIYLALDQRLVEVDFLVNTRKDQAQLEAWDIMTSPLVVDGNVVRTLIDSDPIPPLPSEEILPRVTKLFETLEAEFQREATIRRSKQISVAYHRERENRAYALDYNPEQMLGQQAPYYC